ncbi:MAG TPA: TspO/MBR family protein [Kineosporiaceae bacterium]
MRHGEGVRPATLAATTAAVTATAIGGALATDPRSPWYRHLDKPAWQPPPQAFGRVWTALYADLAVVSARALTGLQHRDVERRAFLRALGGNLVLNAGWSWLFFRAHRPWWAAAESAALTASSVDLARRAGRVSRGAGRALLPYPAWCAFATALTVALARRNPRHRRR